MLFFGECIACSGPGAVLNSNGVCQCADFASLVTDPNDPSAVEACQCNANFLPFNDVCVMCSGIGAVLSEAGVCTCGEGAQLNIVDDLLQCVCPATWTESNDKCFQCDNGQQNLYDTDTKLFQVNLSMTCAPVMPTLIWF